MPIIQPSQVVPIEKSFSINIERNGRVVLSLLDVRITVGKSITYRLDDGNLALRNSQSSLASICNKRVVSLVTSGTCIISRRCNYYIPSDFLRLMRELDDLRFLTFCSEAVVGESLLLKKRSCFTENRNPRAYPGHSRPRREQLLQPGSVSSHFTYSSQSEPSPLFTSGLDRTRRVLHRLHPDTAQQ